MTDSLHDRKSHQSSTNLSSLVKRQKHDDMTGRAYQEKAQQVARYSVASSDIRGSCVHDRPDDA